MTIPALLLVTASLAAPPPGVLATASGPRLSPDTSTVRFDTQRGEGPDRRKPGKRPHTVGVGGQVTISNRGAGGGFRYFFGERVGVNFSAGWYQNGSRYTSNTQQGSTFAALPSVLVMLTKPNKTRDVDIRPYVGGGLNYVRSSTPVQTRTTTTLQQRSGTGGQVFGGVEMTFRDADMVTISAEGIYYSLPVNYVNSSVVNGFNYLLAFHFYLK